MPHTQTTSFAYDTRNRIKQQVAPTFSKSFAKSMTLIAAIAFASDSIGNELGIDVNSEAFKVQFDSRYASNDLNFTLSALVTEDNGEVAGVGLYNSGLLDNGIAFVGLGGKLYHVGSESNSFQALGLGGFVEVGLGNIKGLTAGVEAYYAPSITATKDADNFIDITLKVTYELFEGGSIYAGIRQVEAEYNGQDDTFNDDLHIGIQFRI